MIFRYIDESKSHPTAVETITPVPHAQKLQVIKTNKSKIREMSLKGAYSNKNKMPSSANFSNGGETEYPATLQELVLNYLCKNLDEICVTKPVITTPKRRRVHSGPNHCFASEMDLDEELQLLERVSGRNTNSYTDEVRAENLQENNNGSPALSPCQRVAMRGASRAWKLGRLHVLLGLGGRQCGLQCSYAT